MGRLSVSQKTIFKAAFIVQARIAFKVLCFTGVKTMVGGEDIYDVHLTSGLVRYRVLEREV